MRAPVPPGCDLHEPDQAKDGHFYDYAKEVVAQATGCVSTTKPGRHEYRNGYGHVKPGDKYAIKPTPNGSSGTCVCLLPAFLCAKPLGADDKNSLPPSGVCANPASC